VVQVPSSLRNITKGKPEIQASGKTIGELISDIDRMYPGFQAKLCDDTGQIRKFIAIFVDGNDIRTLKKDQTHLRGNENISIITAVAGG
jgi:molybdopterin synthase sulfur carrier subunit